VGHGSGEVDGLLCRCVFEPMHQES